MFLARIVSAIAASILAASTIVTVPTQPRVCGLSSRAVQRSPGGVWTYSRANAFDTSGQNYCIAPNADSPGFTITTNLRYTGKWQAYPFTGIGCAYNLCSRGTDLPKRVRALPYGSNVSFSWSGVNAPGYWNTALDIWFDKQDQITRQDNGAELMIWLRTPPGYNGGHRVHIGNRLYWFLRWKVHNGKYSWWYVQFRTTKTVMSVRQLRIKPFLAFLRSRGYMKPWWYLTSVHAGYEVVNGSKGLHTTWFNAQV